MAQLVMRRDLALYRDKSKTPKDAPQIEAPSSDTLEKDEIPSSDTLADEEMEDVKIADASPSGAIKDEPTAELAPTSADEPPSTSPETKAEQPEEKTASAPEPDVPADSKPQPETQDSEQPSKDESTQPPPDSTTFSNTPDLDYLFGGPVSAEPGDNAAAEFNFGDPTGTNTGADDFDFDAFANSLAGANGGMPVGEDNIASLLPGLEDYANTAPVQDATMDFDDIFNSTLPTYNATGGDGNNSQAGPPQDTTFDDLLDLPDFGVGELTGENGGEGGAANQEFDFDMS